MRHRSAFQTPELVSQSKCHKLGHQQGANMIRRKNITTNKSEASILNLIKEMEPTMDAAKFPL